MKKLVVVILSAIFLNACSTNSNNDSPFQTISPPNWLIGSVLEVGCGAGNHSYNKKNPDDWSWEWIKENERFKTLEKGFIAELRLEIKVDEIKNRILKNV